MSRGDKRTEDIYIRVIGQCQCDEKRKPEIGERKDSSTWQR